MIATACAHATSITSPADLALDADTLRMICEDCETTTGTLTRCTDCIDGMLPQPTTHTHPLRYRAWVKHEGCFHGWK